jgi:hypothetical protein
MNAVGAGHGVRHLTGELEGLGKQERAGSGRVRAGEGAVSVLNLAKQSGLGVSAEGGGRLRGVQFMEVVVGDGTHTREAGGGRVIGGEVQTFNRDGGAAAALISLFVGGQFKPGGGVGVSHVSVFLLHSSTLFICAHGNIVGYSRVLVMAGGACTQFPISGQGGRGGAEGGGVGGWVVGEGGAPAGAGRGGAGKGGGFRDSGRPLG